MVQYKITDMTNLIIFNLTKLNMIFTSNVTHKYFISKHIENNIQTSKQWHTFLIKFIEQVFFKKYTLFLENTIRFISMSAALVSLVT